MSSPADDAAKPGVKRSLFNKPAWSRPTATINTTDFFHRSNQIYVDEAVEAELKKKRRATHKAQGKSRRESTTARDGKRRRLSNDDDSENEQASNEGGEGVPEEMPKKNTPTKSHTKVTAVSLSPRKLPESPESLADRYENVVAAAKAAKIPLLPSNVIDLEDDDELESVACKVSDANSLTKSGALSKTQAAKYDDFISSDEEFPELARQAREKARAKQLQAEFFQTDTPPPALQPSQDESTVASKQASQPPLPAPRIDPVVTILLTSSISNTKPLIVARKLGQRLKDVRLTWCERQGFAPNFTSTVILTWRGKRLYDVSTCRSLGIAADADGNIVVKGEKDVFGEENRQIHMEAMTEETFQTQRLERERVAAMEARKADEEEEEEVPMAEEPKAEEQVKIILRSKGREEFKLIVKPVSASSVELQFCRHKADGCTVDVGITYHQCFSPEQGDSTNFRDLIAIRRGCPRPSELSWRYRAGRHGLH